MPRVSDIYGGAYLKATDLNGGTYQVQIERVTVEEVGEDREEKKRVAAFVGAKKPLVLNSTNANILGDAWGDDSNTWPGRRLELFVAPTSFNGKPCQGLRVRPIEEVRTSALMTPTPAPQPQGVPASQTKAALQAAHENSEDLPF